MTTLLIDTERNMTPEQAKCVNLIRSSGDSLLSIIDDILDFSRIESNKFSLHVEPFHLRKTVEDVLDLFRSQCVTRQLRLTHWIAEDVPDWVRGDEKRIRQVLWNIIGNAVKFSKTGGYVSLEVECDPGLEHGVRFAVTDTGIGIAATKITQLFSPFTQADSSVNRRFGGSGLGLALVKRLVGLMNGDIWVSSAEGRGSVFRFNVSIPDCSGDHATGALSPSYFGLSGPLAHARLASGGGSPPTTGNEVTSNGNSSLSSVRRFAPVGTPPVGSIPGGRLYPFKLGLGAKSPAAVDEITPGSGHNSPGADIDLTINRRFIVIHPEDVSRKNVAAHCIRELKMVCAGSWAGFEDEMAILDAISRERVELVVIHRNLDASESDPYTTLPGANRRTAGLNSKCRNGDNGSGSGTNSPTPEGANENGVGPFLRRILDAVKKRWGRKPPVVMTSWLATAGVNARTPSDSAGGAMVVHNATQMFIPTAPEFDDIVDAHIYIPYRTSNMTETVLQAIEMARQGSIRRGSQLSDRSADSGAAGEADISADPAKPQRTNSGDSLGGMAAARAARRAPSKPSGEIDHTLGKRLPMKILAVDDNSVNNLLATRFLEKMGFEGVQCADDGKMAIEMVVEAISQGEPFDLIITDINMPVIEWVSLRFAG